jgi:hypothetical protein
VAHKKRMGNEQWEGLKRKDHEFVESFEAEYARLLEEKGLEVAKAYFRDNFMVRCIGCGYLGKTVPPLNCARCSLYVD